MKPELEPWGRKGLGAPAQGPTHHVPLGSQQIQCLLPQLEICKRK